MAKKKAKKDISLYDAMQMANDVANKIKAPRKDLPKDDINNHPKFDKFKGEKK